MVLTARFASFAYDGPAELLGQLARGTPGLIVRFIYAGQERVAEVCPEEVREVPAGAAGRVGGEEAAG